MTPEQINAAIGAESGKYPQLTAAGHHAGANWALSQLSAWGYVKAPETEEEVKELSEWNESKSKIIHGQQQEIDQLKDYNVELSNKSIELMKENERLKGLIEDAYFDAWNICDYSLNMVRCFEEFKQKHGL